MTLIMHLLMDVRVLARLKNTLNVNEYPTEVTVGVLEYLFFGLFQLYLTVIKLQSMYGAILLSYLKI
jgi:hypothetical protein